MFLEMSSSLLIAHSRYIKRLNNQVEMDCDNESDLEIAEEDTIIQSENEEEEELPETKMVIMHLQSKSAVVFWENDNKSVIFEKRHQSF